MVKILGQEHNLGSFKINSGEMIIGDPCYSPHVWCLGYANNVSNGYWESKVFIADNSVTGWGDRSTALFAFNKKYFKDNFGYDDIAVEHFMNVAYEDYFGLDVEIKELGVDSGQAGIYDSRHYIKMHEEDKKKEELSGRIERDTTWYWSQNAEITLSRIGAGINPDGMGCVSSSGYGDGTYDYYVYRNKNGYVVAILIIFIREDEVL